MCRFRLATAATFLAPAAFAADPAPAVVPAVTDSTALTGVAVTLAGLIVREIAKEVRARKSLRSGQHTQPEREWLRGRVEKLEQQVKDLIDMGIAREAEMGRLRNKVAELEAHNTELTKQIASRDAVISELQTNVGKLTKSAGA
jgi:predicted RNase H-like nuclease (RuvC/YqgF family)